MPAEGIKRVMAARAQELQERNALIADIAAWLQGGQIGQIAGQGLEAFLSAHEHWQEMMRNGGLPNVFDALARLWYQSASFSSSPFKDFIERVLARGLSPNEWHEATKKLGKAVLGI